MCLCPHHIFFFFNDTATTEIYTLSLHDALPIFGFRRRPPIDCAQGSDAARWCLLTQHKLRPSSTTKSRSEEHTSELQSRQYLVCRLLLEKKIISVTREFTTYSRSRILRTWHAFV